MMAEDYGMPTKSSILLYQTEDGRQRIEVRLENETVWLSQRLLAELFQKDVRTIHEHIKNIYDEYELLPESTIRNFRIVQTEGKSALWNCWSTSILISLNCKPGNTR